MSTLEIRPAPVRRSVVVKAGVERSFAAFTGNIGHWWPKSHTIGSAPPTNVVLEARTGGRWYEVDADGGECEWGKVLLWEPPNRLILGWQINGNWKYDPAFMTEVEIMFTALEGGGTRVDLEHRNLERYGDRAASIRDAISSDGGWLGILKSFATNAEAAEA